MSGVKTNNVTNRTALSDDVLVNRGGSTGLQRTSDLATQLASTGPIATAIAAAAVKWVTFVNKAAMDGSLNWPDGQEGRVYAGVGVGIYRKTGAVGAGTWTYVGPIPDTDLTDFSALPNLFENGNLSDGGRGVRLYDPDLTTGSAWTARLGGLPASDYLKSLGCDNAIYVPFTLGGNGNLVTQDVTIVGGYLLVSMLVRASSNWTFGSALGLVAYARYTDGTSETLSSAAATLSYEVISATVRRYYGTIALSSAKTCNRVDLGLNDGGARTSNFFLTGFWASWSRSPVTISQTAYPNWRAGVADITRLRATVDQVTETTRRGKVASLASRIADPLRSIILVLIGDSNTYGLGALGIGVSFPRNHSLSDPRDGMTSGSWANLLGAWLGQLVCGGENFSNPGPGVRQYRQSQLVDPSMHDSVVLYTPEGLPINKIAVPTTGGKLYQYTTIAAGQYMEFEVYGDNLTIWYTTLANNPAQVMDVYVGGALHGSPSAYSATAQFSARYDINTGGVGRRTIKIANNSAYSLRIEAIEHHRICRVINNGIIGTNSGQWLPGGTLLADGWPINATDAFIMLGTNDRPALATPQDAVRLERNLGTMVDWGVANRPFTSPVLMTSVRAVGSYEEPGNPGTYFFSSSEVALANARVAAKKKLPLIDLYGEANRIIVRGDNPLDDGLHWGDLGHRAVFEVISRAIFG